MSSNCFVYQKETQVESGNMPMAPESPGNSYTYLYILAREKLNLCEASTVGVTSYIVQVPFNLKDFSLFKAGVTAVP